MASSVLASGGDPSSATTTPAHHNGSTITKAAQHIFQFSSPLVVFFVRNPEIAIGADGAGDIEQTTSPPEVDRVMKRMERELNEVDASHLVGSGVPGASVSLSFAKASTLYHHGAAALHVFLLLIPSKKVSGSSSRIKRAALMAKEWRDELLRTGAAETNCVVFLLHQDLVDAGASPNPIDAAAAADVSVAPPSSASGNAAATTTDSATTTSLRIAASSLFSRFGHQKTHVEEALDAVHDYMEEFRKRIPSPMNINIYQPSSYKEKLLDALKNSYQEHALQLKALRHQCHTARSVPGWCIQEFWRKGYDLAMHHLRYGAIHEAISCFTSMFTEYYNHSDDLGFVVDWSFLRDIGQTRNVLDPLRATTSDSSRGGLYPSSFADAAEVIDGLMFVVGAEMTCALFLGNREGALARFASFLEVVKEKLSDINREESSLGTSSSARHSAVSSYDAAASPQVGLRATPLTASLGGDGPAVFRFDPCMRRVAPPLYLQHFFLFRCCMSALDLCTGSNLAARVGSLVQRNTHGHFTVVDGNTLDASHLVAGLSGCPTPSATPQKVRPDAAASLSSPAGLMGSTGTAIFDGAAEDSTSSCGGAFAYSVGSIDDAVLAASGDAARIGAMCEKEYVRYCVVVGDLCLEARNHLVELAGLCGFHHPVSSALSAPVGVPPSSGAHPSGSTDSSGGGGGVATVPDADPSVVHQRTSSGPHYRTSASPCSTSAVQSVELRKWLGLECFATVAHFHATFLSITRVAASAFRKGHRIKQSHALLCHEAAVLLSIDPQQAVDLLHRMVVPYYRNCGWRSLLLHAEELYVQSVRWLLCRHRGLRHGVAASSSTEQPVPAVGGVPLAWFHAAQQYALDLAIEYHPTPEKQALWCHVFAELQEEGTDLPSSTGTKEPLNQKHEAFPSVSLSHALHGHPPGGASSAHDAVAHSSMRNSYGTHPRQWTTGSNGKVVAPHSVTTTLQSLVTDTISISCVKRMTADRIMSALYKAGDDQRHGLARKVSSGFLGKWRGSTGAHHHRPSSSSSSPPTSLSGQLRGSNSSSTSSPPQSSAIGLAPLPKPRWVLHHHRANKAAATGLPSAPHALIDEPVTLVVMVASVMDPNKLGVATSATVVLHSKKRWLADSEPVHIVELTSAPLQYDAELRAITLVVPFTPCHAGTYKVACLTIRLGLLVLTHSYSAFTTAAGSLASRDGYAESEGGGGGPDGGAAHATTPRGSVVVGPPLPGDHGTQLTLLVVPEPDAGIQLSVDVPPVHHCFGDLTTNVRVGVRVTEPLKPPPPPSSTAVAAADATEAHRGDGGTQQEGAAHTTTACFFEGASGMQITADGGATSASYHGTAAHLRGIRSERMDAAGMTATEDRQPPHQEPLAQIRIGRPPRRQRGRTLRPSLRGGAGLRPRTPSLDGGGGASCSLSPHRTDEAVFSGGGESFSRTIGAGGSMSDYPMDQQVPNSGTILLDGTTQLFTTTRNSDDPLISIVGGGGTHPPHHALFHALSESVRSCLPEWTPLGRVTVFQHAVALDNNNTASCPVAGAATGNSTAVSSGSPPDAALQHRTPLRSSTAAGVAQSPPPPLSAPNGLLSATSLSSTPGGEGAAPQPPLLYHRDIAVTVVANEYVTKLASCNTAFTNLKGATLDVVGSALEPSGYTTLSLLVPQAKPDEAAAVAAHSCSTTEEDASLYRDAVLKASLITVDVPLLPVFMKGDTTPLSFSCPRNREVSVRHTKLSAPFTPAFAVAYAYAPFQERMFVTVTVRNALATCTLWLRHAVLQVLIAEPGETMTAYAVKTSAASNTRLFHQPLHPGDTVAFLFELSLLESYRCQQVAVRHGTRLCVAYSPWSLYDKEGVFPLPSAPPPQLPPQLPAASESSLSPSEAYDDTARLRYQSLESLQQLHDATNCNLCFCAADHFTSKHLCAFNVMVLIEGMDELDADTDDEEEADPMTTGAGSALMMASSAAEWSAPSTPLPHPLTSESSWTRRGGGGGGDTSRDSLRLGGCGTRHTLHATTTTTVGEGSGDPSASASRLHEAGDPVHFRAILHPQAQNWPTECRSDKDQFLVSIDVSASDWLVLGRQRHARVLTRDAEHHVAFSATPIGRGSSVPLPSISIRHVRFDPATGCSSVSEKIAVDVAKCRAFLRLKRSRGATVLHHVAEDQQNADHAR